MTHPNGLVEARSDHVSVVDRGGIAPIDLRPIRTEDLGALLGMVSVLGSGPHHPTAIYLAR